MGDLRQTEGKILARLSFGMTAQLGLLGSSPDLPEIYCKNRQPWGWGEAPPRVERRPPDPSARGPEDPISVSCHPLAEQFGMHGAGRGHCWPPSQWLLGGSCAARGDGDLSDLSPAPVDWALVEAGGLHPLLLRHPGPDPPGFARSVLI